MLDPRLRGIQGGLTMPYVNVNGQRIAYGDTGSGDDVIVFSHGFFMSQAMFAPQVAALANRWRCITWDARGHGATEATDDPFSYWDSAADLLGLLDALGIEEAVLAGMSQGGYVSLRAALSAPERVRALVLIDTQSGLDAAEKAAGYDQLIDAWLSPDGPPAEVRETLSTIIIGAGHSGGARWIDEAASIPEATVRQIYSTLATRDDITERIGELTMPALVVHGSDDLAIGVDEGRALAQRLPAGRLAVIDGAGHAANLTHSAAVNLELEAFLTAQETP
ncbi:alpha/beta hydrolase [Paraconexibacter antarcticus]|uniref:Alpha/beta hydrolase n=1 Tax=Paraconexibacter antarcticus TaxID=2949664 RepID=A0ABY5DXN1_9ACTN|nr:alpha/beta hydrolase [Paraconexibacter antarcticus]UTI66783.1 alpha/beta hydrolase [Paraconexibacter antarcticus]